MGKYDFPFAYIADLGIPARNVPRPATQYKSLDLPSHTELQCEIQLSDHRLAFIKLCCVIKLCYFLSA